tara:strand:+ start:146 stop:769 length:624 start_codon:yes stop_codon:yes gene_type:complete
MDLEMKTDNIEEQELDHLVVKINKYNNMAYIQKKSPLNQDAKFNTTQHDYGKKAHTMTPKERSEDRRGKAVAVTAAASIFGMFNPPALGAKVAANVGPRVLMGMPKFKKATDAAKSLKEAKKAHEIINKSIKPGKNLSQNPPKSMNNFQDHLKFRDPTKEFKRMHTPYKNPRFVSSPGKLPYKVNTPAEFETMMSKGMGPIKKYLNK